MDISFADIFGMIAIAAFVSSTFFQYFKRTEEDDSDKMVSAEMVSIGDTLSESLLLTSKYSYLINTKTRCSYCNTPAEQSDNSCKKCGAPID